MSVIDKLTEMAEIENLFYRDRCTILRVCGFILDGWVWRRNDEQINDIIVKYGKPESWLRILNKLR